jgi:hypothetical protein
MDKDRESRTTIYFTDNYNPVRNIELGKLDKYINSQNTVCGSLQETFASNATMLQFRSLVSGDHSIINRAGRTVTRGTYQFLLAYADPSGKKYQYYALTNLVSVFDLNNNIQAPFKKSQK